MMILDIITNMNIEKLIESILTESPEHRFSPEIEEKLFLLNNSKELSGVNGSRKIDFMDKVFATYKNTTVSKIVYRATYVEEYKSLGVLNIGDTFTFDRYKSFTENFQVAKEFNKGYGIYAFKKHTGGFPYYKWMAEFQKELKVKDPEKYNSYGNSMYEDTAKYEKEWIFNIGTKVKVIGFTEKDSSEITLLEMI